MKFVYCRGNNPQAPDIARTAGMEYGVNYRHKAYAPIYMLDIGIGEKVQWVKYLAVAKRLKPQIAFTYDYIDACMATTLYRQIYDLQMLDIPQIAVCPKWHGAIKQIPQDCIVALSVPAPSYAGWLPEQLSELQGRKCHLLGGSIANQSTLITKLNAAGATVVSADGSHHAKVANQYGKWWDGGRWVQMRSKAVSSDDLIRASAGSIVRTVEFAMGISQPQLI